MLVLDTDYLAALDRGSAAGMALQRRLEDASDEVATTIISAEEQWGWPFFTIGTPYIQADVVEDALRAHIKRAKTAWPG